MNIIFLDVDGVLNSQNKLIELYNKTNKSNSGINFPFDEKCLEYLKILVEETRSYIVITSTWRKYKKEIELLNSTLDKYNLKDKVIGYTPILNKKREYEIKEYIKSNNIDNFVIIDDINDMNELNDYLVATSYITGLTKENIEQATKILRRENGSSRNNIYKR